MFGEHSKEQYLFDVEIFCKHLYCQMYIIIDLLKLLMIILINYYMIIIANTLVNMVHF